MCLVCAMHQLLCNSASRTENNNTVELRDGHAIETCLHWQPDLLGAQEFQLHQVSAFIGCYKKLNRTDAVLSNRVSIEVQNVTHLSSDNLAILTLR